MRATDPDRVLRAVGRRVAELRLASGLTQERLAEKLSVSSKYVQQIEAGTQNLSLRSLARIADAVSAPLVALLEPPKSLRSPAGRPRGRSER